jgi:hypothetical protein
VIVTSVGCLVQDMTLFIILPSSNECKSLFNTWSGSRTIVQGILLGHPFHTVLQRLST